MRNAFPKCLQRHLKWCARSAREVDGVQEALDGYISKAKFDAPRDADGPFLAIISQSVAPQKRGTEVCPISKEWQDRAQANLLVGLPVRRGSVIFSANNCRSSSSFTFAGLGLARRLAGPLAALRFLAWFLSCIFRASFWRHFCLHQNTVPRLFSFADQALQG